MKFTYKAQVIYADYSFLLLLFLFITTACIIQLSNLAKQFYIYISVLHLYVFLAENKKHTYSY